MAASAAGEVKLLGFWPSPYVIRVQIALNLKGIEHEFVAEDLQNKSELLVKSNPVYKKIPVLIHDGKPVCESLVIIQYIDEAWAGTGPEILPADPYDRAIARFWAIYIDDKWIPSVLGVIRGKTKEERAKSTEDAFAGLQLLEGAFEKCSKGKPFFGGDTIGYVDMALGSFLGWVRAVKELRGVEFLDESKTPQLASWAERFGSSEAAKELVETEKFVEFGKIRFGEVDDQPAN